MNTPKGSCNDNLPAPPQSVSSLSKSRVEWHYMKDLLSRGKDLWDLTYSA